MTQVDAWGLQIRWLIGFLFALLLLGGFLVFFWAGLHAWLARKLRRQAEDREKMRKLDRNGRPLPPVGGGICERCSGVFDDVYHLTSGQRLCKKCYDEDTDV